jgi:hypothetical protein
MSVVDINKVKEIAEAIEVILGLDVDFVPESNLVRFTDAYDEYLVVWDTANRQLKVLREDYYKIHLTDIVQFRYHPKIRFMFVAVANGLYSYVMMDHDGVAFTKINMRKEDWESRDWLFQDKGI